ncbi:chromate transporter [Atractiella rhizophila]|nr:chromate transporter [Atractiella rhizophila]
MSAPLSQEQRDQPSTLPATSPQVNTKSLSNRLADVFVRTWDLGLTSFGGPAVHFHIFHQRFVDGRGRKERWVDEQTYQELFAVCQSLPGPASTKMLFCLALQHAGLIPAIVVFLIWSLPGAIGMYALSLSIQRISDTLPAPVYALLSGLNASAVGVIALAATQLAEKAISDKLTRILIILGACAGLCYNALWYFPLLMLIGGLTSVVWNGWMSLKVAKGKARWRRRNQNADSTTEQVRGDAGTVAVETVELGASGSSTKSTEALPPTSDHVTPVISSYYTIPVKVGIAIIFLFFASLIAILVTRGSINKPPLALDLFANMYLAGTIIFGGGPVVIPLLRSYVVGPGWISSRDFLLGLALIQSFPGPNFNFAVYLGALALRHSHFPTVFGAFLGFVGLFFPGLTLALAVQTLWGALRKRKWVVHLLRGVNATAVGLVFTATYRLWEIGYLTVDVTQGQSLGVEPWWVVVAVTTYAESAWFNIPPAIAIVSGALLGLCWYGAVGH